MTDPTIAQSVLFPDLFDKPLVATFDREQSSSDGGAVLLKAAERVYGLVKAFGRCLIDRPPEKVRHARGKFSEALLRRCISRSSSGDDGRRWRLT